MFVVDMPTPNLHVVLGQGWLKAYRAVLFFADGCVRLWQGDRRAVLKCVGDDASLPLPPPPPMPAYTLNFMQFQEAIKEKGSRYFVVNVLNAEGAVAEAAEDGEIPEPNCNKRFKSALHPIVEAYLDVFAELPAGLPPDRGVGHSINTGNSPPISKPMYRLSTQEKAEVERPVG